MSISSIEGRCAHGLRARTVDVGVGVKRYVYSQAPLGNDYTFKGDNSVYLKLPWEHIYFFRTAYTFSEGAWCAGMQKGIKKISSLKL